MRKTFLAMVLALSAVCGFAQGPDNCGQGASVCQSPASTSTSGTALNLPSNGGVTVSFTYNFGGTIASAVVAVKGCIAVTATASACDNLDSYTQGGGVVTINRTTDLFSGKAPTAAYGYYIVTPTWSSGSGTFTVVERNINTSKVGGSGGNGGGGTPYPNVPEMDGTGSAGTSSDYARGDHVHPSDTSREAVSNKSTDVTFADNSDTEYPSQKAAKTYVASQIPSVPSPSSSTPNVDSGSGAAGSSAAYARGDHTHPTDTSRQAALGFTAENVANKDTTTTLGTSDTKYPSQNAVKTYVDTGLGGKQNSLGFTAEDVSNKDTTNTLGTSDTKYPSQNAVKTYVDTGLGGKQNSLGFTAENAANKDTDVTLAANDNTHYPTDAATRAYIASHANAIAVAGVSGDAQGNNGSGNLAALHINDNGTTITGSEPFDIGQNYENAEYYSHPETAGAGGVAANTLVTFDTSNPSRVITAPTNATGVIGITATSGAANAGVRVVVTGDVNCIADNTVTAGDLVGVASTTAGRCKDLGVTTSQGVTSTTQIIGKAEASGTAGNPVLIHTYGAGHYGTLVVAASTNTSVCSDNSCTQTAAKAVKQTVGHFKPTFASITTAQTWATMATNAGTFPINFNAAGVVSVVKCGTNPSGTVVFTFTDATTSTTLGQLSLASTGIGTFTTTGGTTQTVAADDLVTVVSGTDTTAANCVIDFKDSQ